MQVVREKLYRRIHKELPYRLDIKLTQSEVLRDGSSLFHYTIICPSEAVSLTFKSDDAHRELGLMLLHSCG